MYAEKKEFVLILGGLILSIILFVACSKCSQHVINKGDAHLQTIKNQYKFVCWSGGVSVLSAFVFLASLNTIGYNNFKLMNQFFMLLFLFLGVSLGMVYHWRKDVLGLEDESSTRQDEVLRAFLFMGSVSAGAAFSIMALEYNRSRLPIELKQSSTKT